MKYKTLKITILFLSISLMSFAQDENTHKSDRRFFTGGGLGLQFGTETIIDVSPILGYKITDRFHAGIGVKYQFYRYKYLNYDFSTSIYGGSLFARYYLLENLFAHGEYELISYDASLFYYLPQSDQNRVYVKSLLLGGGYRQEISPNAAFVFLLLWNFTETEYTLYDNPIIRIGINVGL